MMLSANDDKFKSLNASMTDLDKVSDKKEDEDDAKVTKQLNIEDSIYCLAFTSMISDIKTEYELDPFLNDYFFKCTIVFFI